MVAASENPNQAAVTETLQELLVRHGLVCTIEEGDWVVPNGQLPAIRALWNPKEVSGRLDVQVLLGKNHIIEECFAGLGKGQAAFADAMNNFMLNSLHVLLSSFWGVSDDEHGVTELWNVGNRQFSARIGNIGTRSSAGCRVAVPGEFFPTIQRRIEQEELLGDIHWFRVFFCSIEGQHTHEALRDNEPWEAGMAGLKEIAWPVSDGYYSFRNFIVLRSV